MTFDVKYIMEMNIKELEQGSILILFRCAAADRVTYFVCGANPCEHAYKAHDVPKNRTQICKTLGSSVMTQICPTYSNIVNWWYVWEGQDRPSVSTHRSHCSSCMVCSANLLVPKVFCVLSNHTLLLEISSPALHRLSTDINGFQVQKAFWKLFRHGATFEGQFVPC